jgi:hypothetical protein
MSKSKRPKKENEMPLKLTGFLDKLVKASKNKPKKGK